MKILIVEDDAAKLRRIASTLGTVEGLDVERDVETVADATTARRRLRDARFDLLILDIALPLRIDQDPRPDTGIILLEEVLDRPEYKRPTHIIGITGDEGARATAHERFWQRLLTLVWYDAASTEWVKPLQARVRQMIAAEADAQRVPLDHASDLAIVCALESPELEGVLRLNWKWEQTHVRGDDTIYYRGVYHAAGAERVAVAGAAGRMGMPAAAVLATKMIAAFRPRYVGMTGIMAGVRGEVNFGDVVVADPAWDYGSGKWVADETGVTRFQPAPHHVPLNGQLPTWFARLRADEAIRTAIRRDWPAQKPDSELRIHIGPVGSGAAVLADGSIANDVRSSQSRKVLGFDMEAYAVYVAALDSSAPKPYAFSIKSVVDFADREKDDRYRAYAGYTSAQVLRVLAESYL